MGDKVERLVFEKVLPEILKGERTHISMDKFRKWLETNR